MDETLTLLARRADYSFAAERGRNLFGSKQLEIIRTNHDDEFEALSYFEKYADQKISFTDCLSFAIMKRKGLAKVFSFHDHFARAGFEVFGA